jgi:hypothetical protein
MSHSLSTCTLQLVLTTAPAAPRVSHMDTSTPYTMREGVGCRCLTSLPSRAVSGVTLVAKIRTPSTKNTDADANLYPHCHSDALHHVAQRLDAAH